MFFNSLQQIPAIALRANTSIFVMPLDTSIKIPNALTLSPEDKTVITIEQVRDVIAKLNTKQTTDLFIVIHPAEKLQPEAANALLKSLEEPRDKIHFILITSSPSSLLPTILSRASIYFLKIPYSDELHLDAPTKTLAKQLMVARGSDLISIAEKISKPKDRAYALSIIGAAIEILYRSYYLTGNSVFLQRLPKFLSAYNALSNHGHIKLQIVSNLC